MTHIGTYTHFDQTHLYHTIPDGLIQPTIYACGLGHSLSVPHTKICLENLAHHMKKAPLSCEPLNLLPACQSYIISRLAPRPRTRTGQGKTDAGRAKRSPDLGSKEENGYGGEPSVRGPLAPLLKEC